MNTAPAPTPTAKDPAQRDPERGRLLGLVRKLMDYGRDLVATLQSRNAPNPPLNIAHRFGGATLALIIARITRGLMIAAALERRLLHPRPRAQGQARPTQSTSPRPSRTPRKPQPDEAEELLGSLPSAREIAARLRNRKTGAVIVDICRDLGIATDHPLWREIRDAIRSHGGNMAKLLCIWLTRGQQAWHLPLPHEDQARCDRLMAAFTHPS